MAKIKLTKGELKRQRDSLSQFRHYLPTLQLKKRQLQTKILEVRKILDEKKTALEKMEVSFLEWMGLLGDSDLSMMGTDVSDRLQEWIVPKKENVVLETINIAGANVPVLEDIHFPEPEYDLFMAPFWVSRGLDELRSFMTGLIELTIIEQQIKILSHELRVTTQRVNLFEKVKIPECLENIRKIRIYLGDQQANAVGISKVAKKKIEAVNALEEVGV